MGQRPRPFKLRVTHPLTGKVVRISGQTRREVEAIADHIDSLRNRLRHDQIKESEVRRIMFRYRGGRSKTLEQATRSYLARRTLARNTKRRTESVLTTYFARLPKKLEELEVPALSEWLDELGRMLVASTVRMVWKTLSAVMRHALERGMIDVCPWGTWKPERFRGKVNDRPPREAARNEGELLAMIQVAYRLDAGDGGCRGHKIAAAGYFGLRQGELAGLRWPDLDSEAETVTLRRGADGPTKGRRVDVLVAPRAVFNSLAMWRGRLVREDLYDERGPVFPCPWLSKPGKPRPYPDRSEVLTTKELREVVAGAGLPHPERWTPHSLRTSFVTIEAADWTIGDLARLRDRTRHASIEGLARYLKAHTRELAPTRMLGGFPTPAPALPPARKGT